jgi:proline iminopeptidase
VIRFEGRGCGRSGPLPPYTVETCLTDLEAIRQHYRIERWIVAGHSAGADLLGAVQQLGGTVVLA